MIKELTPAQKGVMVFFLGVILCGAGMRLYFSSEAYGRSVLRGGGLAVARGEERKMFAVDVGGAVRRAGVYRLAEGSTRLDAARAAGGLVGADTSGVNLAGKVSDGEKIYFPAKGELRGGVVEGEGFDEAEAAADEVTGAAQDEPAGAAVAQTGVARAADSAAGVSRGRRSDDKKKPRVVNLNVASAADLESLPGVGPSTAKKIIELRKLRGPFGAIEEIMLVKGIGVKKYEKMKMYLRVN